MEVSEGTRAMVLNSLFKPMGMCYAKKGIGNRMLVRCHMSL
jgi:hypothetical protein